MARMIFASLPIIASISEIVCPAAIEIITQSGFKEGAIAGRTSANLFGFTAKNKRLLAAATSSL